MIVDGTAITAPLRTALDCTRVLPPDSAMVVLDSALRLQVVHLDEFRRAASAAAGPGSARVRRCSAAADPLSGSALETLTRMLFRAHGLAPLTQAVISDEHRFIARVDFLFPEFAVVVEVDGFAYHGDRASFRTDLRRQNALVRAGYRVLRFTWEDVMRRPDHVIRTLEALLS